MNALKINELLPNAKVVFILRDPIDRLISWFRFSKQQGLLENDISFSEYIKIHRVNKIDSNTPMHLRALEYGRYEKYINRHKKALGNNMLVLSFEKMCGDPLFVVRSVCEFLNMDSLIYDEYIFSVKNKSVEVKFQNIERIFRLIRKKYLYMFMNNEEAIKIGKNINAFVKKAMKYNKSLDDSIVIDDGDKRFLKEYYCDSDHAAD